MSSGKMILNYSDVYPLCQVCVYFVLSAQAWSSHHLIFVPVLCFYSFVCACIAHNALHCKTFSYPYLESLYHMVLTLSYGHPTATLIPGHVLSHHRHTQGVKDAMRTTKMRYKWNLLNLLLFQPTVSLTILKLDWKYMKIQKNLKSRFFTKVCCEWTVLVISQLLLLYTNWAKFLAYIYIPHVFAQWAIVSMNVLQHDGTEHYTEDTKIQERYNSARNFTGYWLNLFTFNNGFHTIHHFFPTMHWSRLAKEHTRLILPHNHPALNQECMWTYIFYTFISPGLRVKYTGEPMILCDMPVETSVDWTTDFFGGDTHTVHTHTNPMLPTNKLN